MFDIGRPDSIKATLHWRCHLIPPGESICGVTVGAMVCPLVHWIGSRSVPCLRAISGGELLCACNTEPRAVRRIAYLPMIANDGERVVVVLSNTVALKLGELGHRTPLRITRPRTKCAPLSVQRVRDFDIGGAAHAKAARMDPQDIREYLLHLWSVDILTRWCNARNAVQEAVANLVEATVAARDTATVPSPAPTSGATELRARLRRARKPSG